MSAIKFTFFYLALYYITFTANFGPFGNMIVGKMAYSRMDEIE